jgi:hypothetical protein
LVADEGWKPYGTTQGGRAHGQGTVFELESGWKVTVQKRLYRGKRASCTNEQREQLRLAQPAQVGQSWTAVTCDLVATLQKNKKTKYLP